MFDWSSLRSYVFRRANFLLTALGLRQKGFYTPYNYLSSIPPSSPTYPEVFDLLERFRPSYQKMLAVMADHEAFYLKTKSGRILPNWNSSFLSPLDAACLYSFVAHFKPARIVEIGSGNTTVFISRAIEDHGLATKLTCIDPQPRIAIDLLPVEFQRRTLSIADVSKMAALNAGDFLFVDSSHILQPDFDVDIILNRILPRLRPGVIVHFHDIFLPYPYPQDWKYYRFNEQNGLISWLLTGQLEPIFASHFVWREMGNDLSAICKDFPLHTAANGGSLWLKVRAPPR